MPRKDASGNENLIELLKDEDGTPTRVWISPQNGDLLVLWVKATHETRHSWQLRNAAWEQEQNLMGEQAKLWPLVNWPWAWSLDKAKLNFP